MARDIKVGWKVEQRHSECQTRLIYLGKSKISDVYYYQCPKCLVLITFLEKKR